MLPSRTSGNAESVAEVLEATGYVSPKKNSLVPDSRYNRKHPVFGISIFKHMRKPRIITYPQIKAAKINSAANRNPEIGILHIVSIIKIYIVRIINIYMVDRRRY